MQFEKKQLWRKVVECAGFIFSYFLFATLLFWVLIFMDRPIPYIYTLGAVLLISFVGVGIKRWLR